MKKALPYILLMILALVVFFIKRCRNNDTNSTFNRKDYGSNANRDHGFDRRVSYIEYTHHAKCRMDCRHVTPSEVEDIMRKGNINYRKSEINATPCPVYALEGITQGDKLRIVFAQCDYKTKVVTVIDLDKEWQCDCPGDDEKYKNRK